jgi:hypothetical protein
MMKKKPKLSENHLLLSGDLHLYAESRFGNEHFSLPFPSLGIQAQAKSLIKVTSVQSPRYLHVEVLIFELGPLWPQRDIGFFGLDFVVMRRVATFPILDPVFDENSFGCRPGRSAHDATSITRQRCWHYDWVVEFDIKGLLMKAMRHDGTGVSGAQAQQKVLEGSPEDDALRSLRTG